MSTVAELGQSIAAGIEPLLLKYKAEPVTGKPIPEWAVNLAQVIGATGPTPKQAIVVKRDGSYSLVPASAVMGAGGLLGVVETPVNSFWPTLPLGSIAVGVVTGLLLGELIDGFLPPRGIPTVLEPLGPLNMANVAVKGIAVVGLGMYGGMLMSRTGALIAGGLLIAQLLADVLPLDQWIRNVVNFFRQLFGQTPLPPLTPAPVPAPVVAQRHRQQVATAGRNDLYAGIFG